MSELQVDAESALLETVLYSSRAMRRLEPRARARGVVAETD